jgi:uncharacterized protein (UPF0333 family)
VPGKGEIMGRWMKKIKNKQYGQAMVEFALTLPIFLLAVIGVIELSRFFLVYSSVYTASREAARYGSSVGEEGAPNYLNCEGIRQVAIDSGWFGGVSNNGTTTDIDVYVESSPGYELGKCEDLDKKKVLLGNRLVVDVSVVYKPLLVDMILPDGITVSAQNGRTIMKEIEMIVTPVEVPTCEDAAADIEMSAPAKNGNDNKTIVVNFKNKSSSVSYQLVEIVGINWNNLNDNRQLNQVSWGDIDSIIWGDIEGVDNDWTGPENPIVNIFEADIENLVTRNLFSKQSQNLFLNFTKNATNTAISFDVKFRIMGWAGQTCVLNYNK